MNRYEHKHAKKLLIEHLDVLRTCIERSTPSDIDQLTMDVLDVVAVYHSVVRPGTLESTAWRKALGLLGWPPSTYLNGKPQAEPKANKLNAVLTEPIAKVSKLRQKTKEKALRQTTQLTKPLNSHHDYAGVLGQLTFMWMDSILDALIPDTGQT